MKQRVAYFILGLVAGVLVTGSLSAVYIFNLKDSFTTVVERSGDPDLPRDTSASAYREMWEWSLRDPSGKVVRLAEFRGKVVVIHLWATWCGPCVKELPEIQSLYDSLRNDGIIFLVVSREDDFLVEGFLRHEPYTFPAYSTTEREPDVFQTDGAWGAIPSTIVLDRSGVIRLKQAGSAVWTEPKTLRFFRSLL